AIVFSCGIIMMANHMHYVLFRVLKKKEEQQTGTRRGWGIRRYLSHPARAIFFLTCTGIVAPLLPPLPRNLTAIIRQSIAMAIVVSLGWFAVGCIYVFQEFMLRRYDLTAE